MHIALPEAAAYHAPTLESRPQDYTENVRLRLEMGRYILAEDYVRAQRGRQLLTREVREALGGRDGLLLPSMPVPATRLGAPTVSISGSEEPVRNITLRLTQLFNITGHPAISLPCGKTDEGLAGRPPDRRHQEPHAGTAARSQRQSKECWGARASTVLPCLGTSPRVDVSKDRVVRPFDWGLDWLAPNGTIRHFPRNASPPGSAR